MKNSEREKGIAFADSSLKKAFEKLGKGRHEEQLLSSFLERAMDDLRGNPLCGITIPSNLWPDDYVKKYKINNLRKYDLPNGWRLIYTVHGNEIEIISVIIEWFCHKDYERKFGYTKK